VSLSASERLATRELSLLAASNCSRGLYVVANLNPASTSLRVRLLSGSFMLLAGSGFVTTINFAYNIAVARFLGPAAFGHASVVYTLLILISAVTLSFQIVSAKVVAQQESLPGKSAAYRRFHKSAWASGIFVALLLMLSRNVISNYLNLPSPILIMWLAVGVAFYVPLGTRRGYLQGACCFQRLATNLVLEGLGRLFGSLLAIALGLGVAGVIAANTAALAIAYLFAAPKLPAPAAHDLRIPDAFHEALQAIVFFIGQVVINNSDIVVVKHFFPPAPAGLYAAVALVGRVIFALSWAVVNTMFPIMAGTRPQDRKGHSVLGISLVMVLAIGGVVAFALRLAPAWIWTSLFGPEFVSSGKYGLPYLLAMYAATTCVYALSVVMIAYEMSYRIANTGWVQLAFSGVLIGGIYRYHRSLQEVIVVQLVMMTLLLVVVAVPFLRNVLAGSEDENGLAALPGLRIIRRVSEDDAICAFLKNDFQSLEFKRYWDSLHGLVSSPDLNSAIENARRRALFFLRHGSLWRELPPDTEWFEVEIQAADLERIRVFPRAQWRKLARGDFSLNRVLRSFRSGHCYEVADKTFLTKILDLSDWLNHDVDAGAVLLIGVTGSGPLTILDGNHRLLAAALNSPDALRKFRLLCGLSPNMAQCCWCKTNPATLFRYAINLLRHMLHDPHAELARLLQSPSASELASRKPSVNGLLDPGASGIE
jgi:O-antigen/teichoic acid export membrane protein